MKAYLHTGPRGKFIGVMESYISGVVPTSTQEIEVRIQVNAGSAAINLRLTQDEANYLANMLLNALQEAPSAV